MEILFALDTQVWTVQDWLAVVGLVSAALAGLIGFIWWAGRRDSNFTSALSSLASLTDSLHKHVDNNNAEHKELRDMIGATSKSVSEVGVQVGSLLAISQQHCERLATLERDRENRNASRRR